MKALSNINVPKIIQPLDLGGYHDDLKGQELFVWVNLSRDMHDRYTDTQVNFVRLAKAAESTEKRLQIGNNARRIVELTEEKLASEMDDEARGALVITRTVAQAEAEDYDDALADVEINNIALEKANSVYYIWLAEVLSQRQDPESHYTAGELREVSSDSYDNDNSSFWRWMTRTMHAMIIGHVNNHLKG